MAVLADSYVDWSSMGKILLISICAGAGLVTIYSIGLMALSASGYMRTSDGQASERHNVAALIGACLCLVVVVGAAIYGIQVMFDK
jgi:hypothetical protein